MSETFIIAKAFWWRHYRVLTAIAGLLVCLTGMLALPLGDDVFRVQAGAVAVISIVVAFTYVVGALSFGFDSHLDSVDSGFPRYLLVLPVRTWQILLWPVILQALVIVLIWSALWLVIHVCAPRGSELAFLGPAVWLVGTGVWLQAVTWAPLRSRLTRAVLTLLFGMLCASVGAVTLDGFEIPIAMHSAVLALYVATGILFTYRNVGAARRGEAVLSFLRWPDVLRFGMGRLPTLPGPVPALLWRMRLAHNSFTFLFGGALIVAVVCMVVGMRTPSAAMILAAALGYINIYITFSMVGVASTHEGKLEMPSYIAALPCKTDDMVKASVAFALLYQTFGWLISCGSVCAMIGLHPWIMGEPWIGVGQIETTFGVGSAPRIIAAWAVLLFIVQWASAMIILSTGFSGRNWVTVTGSILWGSIPLLTIFMGCYLFSSAPEQFGQRMSQWSGPAIIALVITKLLAYVTAMPLMARRCTWRVLLADHITWLVALTLTTGLLWILLPADFVSPLPLVAVIASIVPLVTLRLPYLMLRWNRHR